MSFKTNQWEDGIKWNGVIFPACKSQLKEYADKNNAIRPPFNYFGQESGDIAYDLQTHVKKSQEKQAFAVFEIDRIKAIDVPWKFYLVIYICLNVSAAIGCYYASMNYRIQTGVLLGIMVGFLVALSIMFGVITFFGFKAEEVRDVEKLCHYYNQIKEERVMQNNYQRLNMKLVNMNWGRSQDEIDRVFLYRLNQVRGQSNTLMHAAKMTSAPEVTAELFGRMHTRMHEILFESAGLIKRMHHQVCGLEDWKKAASDDERLPILRQVFAVHLAVRLFGSDETTNYKMISLLAGDNLRELIFKCDELVSDPSFRACVAKASSCAPADVDCAFKDSVRSPDEMVERFAALNKVFTGLLDKLPKREYKRVEELGDIEDPQVTETVTF